MTVSLIRTVILYAIVIVAMRIMGKRQIGEMQAAELVVTLMISDLATMPMQETGIPITNGIIPIVALVFIEIILSFAMLKWPYIRRVISGRPVVVIKDGVPIQSAMRKIRFANDDLLEELRKNGVFDIGTVGCAMVETDGKLSIYLKADQQPLTPETAKIKTAENGMTAAVVSDGVISEFGLSLCEKDIKWLEQTIKKEKTTLDKIYLMTCDKAGEYSVFLKEAQK